MLYQFPHTVFAGFVTASVFVLGICAYHLLRGQHTEFFHRSFRLGLILGVVSILLVTVIGHFQGQYLIKAQPMKMAAANALWESSAPAPFNLVALVDEQKQVNTASIQIPALESLLAYNDLGARVEGLKDLQTASEIRYGPGNYIPPLSLSFWSFRLMILSRLWLLFAVLYSLYLLKRGIVDKKRWLLKALLWSIPVPYITNTAGWVVAEVRRQPWIVFGLQKVQDAVSPFAALYPRVMVSSLNPDWSLTVFRVSSIPYTLKIMTIVAFTLVPVVLLYQGWSYWVFRQGVTGRQQESGY